ncbi:hypothetical protein EG352_07250 [Chryseobacterium indologenes]|uniref:Uncharacterized protein n=1 Tax=Chryseobacterium indologenes TaxID=253 RepID=A0AAD1DU96_CHRID|nr:hypothetical protein [Chryseobacterium indologenes]AZB17575.1 hypothetical protein EG352_07250 [Chryseobacterium indologenes]
MSDLPPPKVVKDSIFTTKTVTIKVKDTILVSVPDSLYYEAYIDCVNNKPVLRDPNEKNTKGINSDINLKDGKLSILITTEAQKIFMKWKEKYIQENKEHTRTVQVPYPVVEKVKVPAEFTFFQTLYLFLGKILFFGSLGLLIYKIPWRSLLKLLGL